MRGKHKKEQKKVFVFSVIMYLQDLFIHFNCLESTYCELTEICINSTLRSTPVIYCWVINHIKMYGLKQQFVIFCGLTELSCQLSLELSNETAVRGWLGIDSSACSTGTDEEMAY